MGIGVTGQYQREIARQLVHTLLTCDIGSFDPERFKTWIKEMDACFRKAGLTLSFEPHHRSVRFTIREISGGTLAFRFTLPIRLRFDDKELVAAGLHPLAQPGRVIS
jgi:hypothetical protein